MSKDWRERILDMNTQPSDELWGRISSELDKEAQLVALKQQNLRYKWMAIAASVALLISVSVNFVANIPGISREELISIVQFEPESISAQTDSKISIMTNSTTISEDIPTSPIAQNNAIGNKTPVSLEAAALAVSSPPVTDTNAAYKAALDDIRILDSKRNIQVTSIGKPTIVHTPMHGIDYIISTPKHAAQTQILWAGADMAANVVDPNMEYAPQATLAMAATPRIGAFGRPNDNIKGEAVTLNINDRFIPEMSLSGGIYFGIKLNDKLGLRSGVQFGTNQASGISNATLYNFAEDKNYPAHTTTYNEERNSNSYLMLTEDYRIINKQQFVSIPFLLSVKIFDFNKLDISFVGGASTDFIIKNEITSDRDDVNSLKFGIGEDTHYRPLLVNATAGLEVAYELAKNYRMVMMPMFRSSLSSVTRENASFSGAPIGLGMNVGVQYYF